MLSISLIFIILIAFINLVVGVVTYLNNPKHKANSAFAVICTGLAGWTGVNYLADENLANALLWNRLAFLAVTVVLAAIVVFANNFPRRKWRPLFDRIFWLLGAAAAGVTLLPGFIPNVYIENGISNVVPGELYPVFLAYFAVAIVLFIVLLVKSFRSSIGQDLARVKYLLLGFVLMIIGASTTNLFLPLALGQNSLARYGTSFTLIFLGLTSAAIVRHRLFDIRLLVARSIAYIMLLGAMAALYGTMLFGVTTYVFSDVKATQEQNVISVVLAIILAFTFQPLRRLTERITDSILYRERYDSQDVINRVGKILASELLLERLLNRSLQQICDSLRVEMGQFMVFNNGQVYKLAHYGPLPAKLLTVPTAAKLRKSVLVADELESGERKKIMDEHGIRLSLMLRTRDEFVGYLLLGNKQSGNIYNDQDLQVLEILAAEMSIAITNAKAYEEIAEFNVTLQQKVDQATAKLRQANSHLEQMDKAKDDFISMASHQLRTPLTTIKGYLSMMLEGDTGKLNPEQKEFAGYALDGAERMVNLVSDLLNVSRMSSGKFVIDRQPADMAALIADEVRQLESHAKIKGLKLIFEKPKTKIPLYEFDADKTRQVIMNFIDNAIYYTKTGSVKVTLETEKDRVRVKVSDTGIGVPAEAQSKLFTKFYRADNAQQVRPDGTGLGLYLAKRVIEDQGGTIIFESVPNRGSTFGFELPVKTSGEKHEPSKQPE